MCLANLDSLVLIEGLQSSQHPVLLLTSSPSPFLFPLLPYFALQPSIKPSVFPLVPSLLRYYLLKNPSQSLRIALLVQVPSLWPSNPCFVRKRKKKKNPRNKGLVISKGKCPNGGFKRFPLFFFYPSSIFQFALFDFPFRYIYIFTIPKFCYYFPNPCG